MAMERYDRITSLIWIVFGIGLCIKSWVLGLGGPSEPGTGFVPFLTGLVIIILSFSLFLEATFTMKRSSSKQTSLWKEVYWKRVVYITILLLAYALLLSQLGFLIATFLVMVFLLKTGKPIKWRAAFLIGLLTSGISYLIFDVWLQVPFPQGVLRF